MREIVLSEKMVEINGIIFALISAIGFGTSLVPLKRMKVVNPIQFQALMSVGIFASTIIASLILNFPFTLTIFGIISGIMWGVANYLSIKAVEHSGLSKAFPIWVGLVILVSFLWGVLFFQEQINIILFAVIGIILLLVGITLVSRAQYSSEVKGSLKGIMFAVIAGIIFGSYVIMLKLGNLRPEEFPFSFSIGVLASAWSIFAIKERSFNKKIILGSLTSGFIWNVANISSFFAIASIGLAIAFPITQLAGIVAVAWGILYFKEIKEKKNLIKIILGALVLIAGVFMLGFSKF